MTSNSMPATEFEVPDGLTELLQEFTVAVLRNRPENLTVFARDFFERKYLNEMQNDTYEKNNNFSDSESGRSKDCSDLLSTLYTSRLDRVDGKFCCCALVKLMAPLAFLLGWMIIKTIIKRI